MSSDPADALAIANLKARYCRAADIAASDPAAARALFAAVFLDEATADYGYGTVEGAAAVAEFLCSAIAGGSEWMLHMIHTPCIVVQGDGATGDWTVMAQSQRRGTGERSIVVGRYADRFARTARGWRIAAVAFLQAG